MFQDRSLAKLREASPDTDVIIWTSKLTSSKYLNKLDPDDYIVQIWSDATVESDDQIDALAKNGFRMIFSNVDSTYLDCGFGAWVGEGNNWCSPYKGTYDNYTFSVPKIYCYPFLPSAKP